MVRVETQEEANQRARADSLEAALIALTRAHGALVAAFEDDGRKAVIRADVRHAMRHIRHRPTVNLRGFCVECGDGTTSAQHTAAGC